MAKVNKKRQNRRIKKLKKKHHEEKLRFHRMVANAEGRRQRMLSIYDNIVDIIADVNPNSILLEPKQEWFDNMPYRLAIRHEMSPADYMANTEVSIEVHSKIMNFLYTDFRHDPISQMSHFIARIRSEGSGDESAHYAWDRDSLKYVRRGVVEQIAKQMYDLLLKERRKNEGNRNGSRNPTRSRLRY